MANKKHVNILKRGVETWNQWREDNPDVKPHLIGAHLEGARLEGADLRGAFLPVAHLEGARLRGANLRGAHLTGAHLEGARLEGADLRGAFLPGADLTDATLTELTAHVTTPSATSRLTVPEDATLTYHIEVTGKQKGSANVCRYFRRVTAVNNGGTTAQVGAQDTLGSTDVTPAGWGGVTITVDNTTDAVLVKVQGKAATNIRWGAVARAVQVLYA